MAEIKDRVVIGFSNLCMPEGRVLTTADADDYIAFGVNGGFDLEEAGIEWTPLRFPAVAAVRAGRELAELGLIHVLHESWRDDTARDVVHILRTKGPLAAAKNGIICTVFPPLNSYRELSILASARGGATPLIVHPIGQTDGKKPPRHPLQTYPTDVFPKRWFQPTPEWAASHGIPLDARDASEIAGMIDERGKKQGLNGIVIDSLHIAAERDGRQFKDPVGLVGALARLASFREVQLALRPDFGGSAKDLRQACTGKLAALREGTMLAAVHSNAPGPVRVITETPHSAITAVGQNATEAYQRINSSVRGIFSRAA